MNYRNAVEFIAQLKEQDKQKFADKVEQKETLCDKCRKEQPSHSCQDITTLGRCAVEHEERPVDKIEPKFHVGDWVMLDRPVLITKVENMLYNFHLYWTSDGTWFGDATKAKLWTIQDAKKGDVLVSQYNNPFIYNGNYNSITIGSYCGITKDGIIKVSTEECNWTENKFIQPATKKQQDLLFFKMKEAGYKLDKDFNVIKI